MRWIPGSTFRMGEDNAYPEEAPAHTVTVSGFWIDEYLVTNADFAAFVTATGRHDRQCLGMDQRELFLSSANAATKILDKPMIASLRRKSMQLEGELR